MKPRASASFCHWPNDSSTPDGHVGPSCVSRPVVIRATTSPAPARSTAASTAGSSSIRGRSPKPTECPRRNSKRKKSWNAPARQARHSIARTLASGVSSTKIEPEGSSQAGVSLRQDTEELPFLALGQELKHHFILPQAPGGTCFFAVTPSVVETYRFCCMESP